MRLTHRHRGQRREAFPPISISAAEITADLIYPARARHRPARTPDRPHAKRR
jgi:hypothetical protein